MKKVLIILIMSLSLSACEMGINPKNYPFYCEIDGKKFVPERDKRPIGGIGTNPYNYEYSEVGQFFSIRVRNSPQVISLLLRFPEGKMTGGKYLLSDDISHSSYASLTPNYKSISNSKSYAQSGWISLVLEEGGKFSGEFEFTTYNEYLGKTVKVTNGKFRNR